MRLTGPDPRGFAAQTADMNGRGVNGVRGRDACGGCGSAVLLHGFAQTHAMWHAVGPALAQHFNVIAPDLRSYGHSGKPLDPNEFVFCKRAAGPAALLTTPGCADDHLVSHDRGTGTAHRLALDGPDAVVDSDGHRADPPVAQGAVAIGRARLLPLFF